MSAGKRVLLVEDEAALLMLVGDALEDLGFDVSAVNNGRVAMEALGGGERFDYVVSDISMPEGVSGLDIAQRAMDADPDASVILVSGLSLSQLPPLPEGARFLPKPYRISQLLELLG
ncbi:MAG: response regulator [Luteimonas sp.]